MTISFSFYSCYVAICLPLCNSSQIVCCGFHELPALHAGGLFPKIYCTISLTNNSEKEIKNVALQKNLCEGNEQHSTSNRRKKEGKDHTDYRYQCICEPTTQREKKRIQTPLCYCIDFPPHIPLLLTYICGWGSPQFLQKLQGHSNFVSSKAPLFVKSCGMLLVYHCHTRCSTYHRCDETAVTGNKNTSTHCHPWMQQITPLQHREPT